MTAFPAGVSEADWFRDLPAFDGSMCAELLDDSSAA
jgi:hypothetical protein